MNSLQLKRKLRDLLAGAAGVMLLFAVTALNAQVKTQTITEKETPTKQATIERGEVVYVSGNDLVVKMENGEIRHFANVPESVKVDVDGKQLGIRDMKPGMKLQRVIITTTTPKTITTVKSVTGTVWNVMPPNSVILTMENGQNQQFKIPNDQKFMIDGQQVDAWGLKKGMKVSATKVVEVPVTVVTQQRKLSGKLPPPPPSPPVDVPILVAEEMPPAPAAAEPAPKALPKTGSLLPLIGLLGLLSCGTSFGIRLYR